MSDALDATSTLRIEKGADRLLVRLHRPEVLNAIDDVMVGDLHVVCSVLEREPKIMILCGGEKDGRAFFAAGADIERLHARRRDDALRGINSALFDRIARLPMPVIAAMDGFALGGGAELAYAADLRIATPRLRIGQPEPGLGIVASAGALWRLRELVGETVAKEILFAGRILTGEEALAVRLVSELHDPAGLVAAAHALADKIARQDPLAIRLTKTLYALPREAHPMIDDIAQAVTFESEAKFERMEAFLRKRSARER
jgi:enoyl-CoA hydratase/carnithine racemase